MKTALRFGCAITRLAGLALLAGAAGCATPTPQYDKHFGEAVRAARLAQTLNPNAGAASEAAPGLDGKAAKLAIERYHDSFKSPPPVTNVINIGGSPGGNSSGGR